jgi:hypothetical protein
MVEINVHTPTVTVWVEIAKVWVRCKWVEVPVTY